MMVRAIKSNELTNNIHDAYFGTQQTEENEDEEYCSQPMDFN
jgi:hypothetical protein